MPLPFFPWDDVRQSFADGCTGNARKKRKCLIAIQVEVPSKNVAPLADGAAVADLRNTRGRETAVASGPEDIEEAEVEAEVEADIEGVARETSAMSSVVLGTGSRR